MFSHQGTPYMRPNMVPSWVPQGLSYTNPHILPHGIPPQPPSIKFQQQQTTESSQDTSKSLFGDESIFRVSIQSYVFYVSRGSQCGKTYFVEQLLTTPCIRYPSKKPRHITWYYNQWQRRYEQLQSSLGNDIFVQGLPE